MSVKILIFHTLKWINAARLGLSFKQNGCEVYFLCRDDHPLRRQSAIDRFYRYDVVHPVRSLREAILDSAPDLIVTCDDRAVASLHLLYRQENPADEAGAKVRQLIERSLGRPDQFGVVESRLSLGPLARETGVLMPDCAPVPNFETLVNWLKDNGFPAVLKMDGTWGGAGVMIVRDVRDAKRAFRKLSRSINLVRAAKHALLDRDLDLFYRWRRGAKPVLSVQKFISGVLANCAVACWEGEIIASIAVEVIESVTKIGTSTVVRVVENEEMLETARRMVRKLGISGFCGFDFVLDHAERHAYLLEINPRATQINHLALGSGHDLPAALIAKILDQPIKAGPAVTDSKIIALFPQEYRRNPKSGFLVTGYHDVPFEEPNLVDAYVGKAARLSSPTETQRTAVVTPLFRVQA